MRILENTNYGFVQARKTGYIVSGTLVILSLLSVAIRGVEFGIDFQGGMEFVVETNQPIGATDARGALTPVLGSEPEVKTYGDENTLLVRALAEGDISEKQQQVVQGIEAAFPGSQPEVVQTNIVGPRFAEDLQRGALYSIFGSLLVIFVYLLVRFEWGFGLAAVATLAHDVIVTLGCFSLLQGITPFSLQIDQTIIAAFLTIVGYSINDTVVIFDRMREYLALFKTEAFETVVNRSINSTLSRTVITSGTTLLGVLVLFIFGGEVLRSFAFALLIGIGIGTYSSIFVAAPIVLELRMRAARKKPAAGR